MPASVEQRLKDYHRETTAIEVYFPNAEVVPIDGTKKPNAVKKQIDAVLKAKFGESKVRNETYEHPSSPARDLPLAACLPGRRLIRAKGNHRVRPRHRLLGLQEIRLEGTSLPEESPGIQAVHCRRGTGPE